MELVRGVYYEDIKKPDLIKKAPKKEDKSSSNKTEDGMIIGMNFDAFKDVSIPLTQEDNIPKTTTRKRKTSSSAGVVPADNNKNKWYSATEPFYEKYKETNNILKSAIAQIDIGLNDMQQDLNILRSSRTLRGKYQQISLVQGNMGSYLANKINAARELNNVITKCNDLEMKRAKDLKELENQDDDKRIMDLYNAMISMPIGGQTGIPGSGFSTPLGPGTFEMTYAGNPHSSMPNIVTTADSDSDIGYRNYLQNKTPAQNMMSIDSNPNIQQVVVHNRQTGQSYFEIMDMSTMTPVPNVEKYDNSFLEDTHMDFINNIATNVNIGESYPIVQIGGDPVLNEY